LAGQRFTHDPGSTGRTGGAVGAGDATVMVMTRVADIAIPLTVARAARVTVEAPGSVGVPLIDPSGARARPAGSDPVAAKDAVYGVPTRPAGSGPAGVVILGGTSREMSASIPSAAWPAKRRWPVGDIASSVGPPPTTTEPPTAPPTRSRATTEPVAALAT
jgi:hypothetical protein